MSTPPVAAVGTDAYRRRVADTPTAPSGASDRLTPGRQALWAHIEHLHLRGLVQSHITGRRQLLERLEAFLGHDLLEAAPAELREWAKRMPRTTARSRYAGVNHVKNFYRWCVEHGHLGVDPARHLPQPKLPRLLPRPISEEDLRKALDNAPDVRTTTFLVLAAYAGLRCTEIAGLSRHDVLDRANPPVLIAHGKGSKDRVVPMCQTVIDSLVAHGMPSRGPIFPRLDGQPGATSAHRVSVVMSTYLAELGIDGRMHTLRHRFATETYRLSMDLRVVQELLGHESPQTTAGYAAYSRQGAVDTVRLLDGARPRRRRGVPLPADSNEAAR